MKRTVIKIDDALCNGCGACVSGCHEGALQLIDGKAVMVSELYCDGLGACIGECPVGAITLEEREAEPYDERAVMERIVPRGRAVVDAHLRHLRDHGQGELLNQGLRYLEEHGLKTDIDAPLQEEKPLACGCPGSMMREVNRGGAPGFAAAGMRMSQPSELRQFPVQLHLLNPAAPFLQGADLLLAADCTAFAMGDFHNRLLRGRMLAVACPKLDQGQEAYIEKLVSMIDQARINTLTVAIMEVPCCGGLLRIAQAATQRAARKVPVKVIVVSVEGGVVSEEWL